MSQQPRDVVFERTTTVYSCSFPTFQRLLSIRPKPTSFSTDNSPSHPPTSPPPPTQHARIAHGTHYGKHDECIDACAAGEEIVRDGVEAEGVPSSIFERAIGLAGASVDGLSDVTEQPTPVETPPTLIPLSLGHHNDTPSLARESASQDAQAPHSQEPTHAEINRFHILARMIRSSWISPGFCISISLHVRPPIARRKGNIERERDADTHQWALSISSPSYVRPPGVEVKHWVDVDPTTPSLGDTQIIDIKLDRDIVLKPAGRAIHSHHYHPVHSSAVSLPIDAW